jgi:NADP-dependent 3-hydroxy acid dehydrogenase YdfG
VGSVAGTIYSEGNIYGATKWAVTAMAENTRRMVTGDGVGVTLINPGAVATNFWDGEGGDVNTLTIRPVGAPIA